MRLIDADELLRTLCAPCEYRGDKCLGADCDVDVVCAIREARAIDAIPVKWLIDRLDAILNSGVLSGKPDDNLNIRSIIQVLRLWGVEMEAKP